MLHRQIFIIPIKPPDELTITTYDNDIQASPRSRHLCEVIKTEENNTPNSWDGMIFGE